LVKRVILERDADSRIVVKSIGVPNKVPLFQAMKSELHNHNILPVTSFIDYLPNIPIFL